MLRTRSFGAAETLNIRESGLFEAAGNLIVVAMAQEWLPEHRGGAV
jgi:hypothetical protein